MNEFTAQAAALATLPIHDIALDPTLPPVQLATTVRVLAPAGGTFVAGQWLTVQWDTQGPVDAHAVLLSQDGGATFGNVSGADLSGLARSFSFILPSPVGPAVQAVVRVRAKLNGGAVGRGGSAPFTLQASDILAPQVTPTAANALSSASLSRSPGTVPTTSGWCRTRCCCPPTQEPASARSRPNSTAMPAARSGCRPRSMPARPRSCA